MDKIFFNRKAKVIEGEEAGKYIMLQDDSEGKTGGFYLYISSANFDNSAPVYDNWFENYETVLNFFEHNTVQWLEE